MARPREFDETEVLDRALVVFWEKGYDGTSIDDLVTATGVGRASLYGAFGDKEGLFERVLARYGEGLADPVAVFDAEPSAVSALEKVMRAWVLQVRPRSGPRGCFLLCTALAGDPSPAAREALQTSNAHMERAFLALIERGQASKELVTTAPAADLARLLIVIAQGLAAAARGGWSTARLDSAVDAALALVTARDVSSAG